MKNLVAIGVCSVESGIGPFGGTFSAFFFAVVVGGSVADLLVLKRSFDAVSGSLDTFVLGGLASTKGLLNAGGLYGGKGVPGGVVSFS